MSLPVSQLGKRLLSSAVLVSLTCYAIFLAPQWLFFSVIEIFAMIGLYEFFVIAEKKDILVNKFLGLFFGALMPFSVYYNTAPSGVLAAACLILLVSNFYRKEKNQALLSTAVTVFGIIYVPWFIAHLLKIRSLPSGPYWAFYTILLIKGGDAGAYFIGRKYGRTKLIEHISPNKSVEGAVACLVTTVFLSFISKLYLPQASFFHLLVMGAGIGILSQLGDLAESLLKREAGIKDSGQIPGLGGILDVLDSLILTVPFVYYYVLHFVLQVPF